MTPVRTAAAVRHVAFEDLGYFAPALRRAGYRIDYRDAGVDDLGSPELGTADLVIVLGGPIGAYEEQKYPWLRRELDLIEHRLAAGLPTIGVCLGAQLLARALGARVYPGPEKELGFKPLTLTDEGQASPLAAFEGSAVLHWHGDTFDLPEGATRLASTDSCENQAFSYGADAVGFQFHPEAGGDAFERWLVGHSVELAQAGVDVPSLRAEHEARSSGLRRRAAVCLDGWLRQFRR